MNPQCIAGVLLIMLGIASLRADEVLAERQMQHQGFDAWQRS